MVKVIFLKQSQLGPELFSKGQIAEVSNNTAHGLIEIGAAKLFRSVLGRETKELISTESSDTENRAVKPYKGTYKTRRI